jgi:hypothetical protein
MRTFFWFLLFTACSGSSEPLVLAPSNPLTDEVLLREVLPQINALEGQLARGKMDNKEHLDLLKTGLPVLSNFIGSLTRFSFHVEKIGSSKGRLEVLLSHDGLLAGDTAKGIQGESTLAFEKVGNVWEWVSWIGNKEDQQEEKQFYFREVLGDRTSAEFGAALKRSLHEEKVSERLLTGEISGINHPLEYESFDRHPGLAVADVDGNGWEDIFVMARWGPNQLLLNDQGQFRSAGEVWGLDEFSHSTSAVFADLDNDGDPDLVLGRSLESSLILMNNEGRFEATSTAPELPKLVSSVSVVDVDSDGLLDIYFSTYAASMIERIRDFAAGDVHKAKLPLQGFMNTAQALNLANQVVSPEFHFYLDRPGPSNQVFRNLGAGKFEHKDLPSSLGLMRNTYQSSWSDVDLDGDPDVYLANDFAPNSLLINDGDWQFSDQAEAMGVSDFGFGMGVGWGDFDGDGRFDLYVSNMYSRTGRRITSKISSMDPRISKAARGNSLFRNKEGGFERVSGLDSGLQVERAGWAWGGQFLDVNNDGLQDLYVPNGYYSAPKEAALDRDT